MARERVDSAVSDKSGQHNDTEEEPDFSDPEDYVDDVTDEELLGDLLKKQPTEQDVSEGLIVVDGVPVVEPERLDKLMNVIRKIFGKFGQIQSDVMPQGEDKKTKGYLFIEYASAIEAAEAVKGANGYKLDKTHTFMVNLMSDFDKYKDESKKKWEAPQVAPYKDHGNMWSWLQDRNCYDQFSVIHDGGDKAAVYLNTVGEPTLIEERARWTETYFRWSPRGIYLATFHSKGIALWGGPNFKQINRFQHAGVQLIDFSPCESYLVTFSPLPTSKEDPETIIIWDVRTGKKKRGFQCQDANMWPVFKWSADGKYFARLAPDLLMVYETPSFGLLDKKSFKVPNIRDFAWSPTDHILSYWTPEIGDQPARVQLVKVPSRNTICQKNLFTVKDCRLHWQKTGDYLCVKVDRYRNRKEDKEGVKYTGIFHNFNVFRIREKQIPVDTVELMETVQAFAWEPVNDKFAVIHGEAPKISVSFYAIKSTIELVKTLEKKQVNHLFWSPNGQFIVLAGLRSMNGILEFVDTSDMSVMQAGEHFMATDVEWDPTGRFVCTAVSWWGHKVDNAFWLWNFQGKLLYKQPMERFCQFLWRPRPPSLLPKEKVKEVKKNMRRFQQMFASEDKIRESKASKEQIERRRRLMEDYQTWIKELKQSNSRTKKQRSELRGMDTDMLSYEADEEEETIEFLLNVETIVEE